MAIAFVRNYQDLSTDRGYQFKFDCDHCGSGYMTRFSASTLGTAQSVMRAAGDLFGGVFNEIGNSAFEVQRMVGGTAHDSALEAAVAECKGHFQQCTRCGHWVCPEVCWNGQAQLCKGCAPRFEEEMAAAHAGAKAHAVRSQLENAAAATNYIQGIDMQGVAAVPPTAPAPPAPAAVAPTGGPHCTGCGALCGTARFCQQCGTPRPVARPAVCACGAAIPAGIKFCGECGAKIG
jgi:hypothetical protein